MAAGFLNSMKRLLNNPKLKIVAATSVTIFSLLVLFIGTYAWFESSLRRTEEGDNFEVSVLDGKLKGIYIHHVANNGVVIDSQTGKPSSFTFNTSYSGKITYDWENKTANYTGDTSITLDQYTPLNHDHPVLLVFELDDAYSIGYDGEIVIRATTETPGFLGERDETNNNAPVYGLTTTGVYQTKTVGSETQYYYALSSVTNFYCTDSSSELYNKDGSDNNTTLINPTYSYSSLRNREQSIAAKELDPEAVVPDLSFTAINNSDETSNFNQRPTIYTSRADTSVRYISVVLDYYSDAIEYIYSTFLGNDTLEYQFHNELDFLCDWGLEIS